MKKSQFRDYKVGLGVGVEWGGGGRGGSNERVRVRELGESGGMHSRKISNLKSSEMARNALKIVNTDVKC